MRAFQVTDHAIAPSLQDVPDPHPNPGEVLVRVHACGLNFADILVAKGTYQDIPPLPATLGMELAGEVVSLGEGVTTRAVGDRVAVNAGHGGLAEFGAFVVDTTVPLPDAMPFTDAAAFMVAYGTSHLGLTRRARLQKGERLVVLGAAGGVGLTAVEIGAALGAEVVAVARGADKLAVAKDAGAHHLIDSETTDLREALKELGGADVVYDPVGGDLTVAAIRACNPEARVLIIGFASGDLPKIAANHLLVKNIDVIGYYWGAYRAFAPQVLSDSLSELLQWYSEGRLTPHVSKTFPLEQAGDAMDFLKSRKSTGKVVVTME
ncbi:NADPH:quinone oxidoreductase family protein [Palleronia sp. THAF1]|uniref:NADPH:quinone oxidoreductase family protein n=1 Tax=Palleronia sp. THAF1 TaxID=2587842 RepID=UPI000F52C393|nr:NADPH:quinone oxidoreductase family protein [Palleronia sp. THAF1]QFU07963.1 Phthiocerol synthesis polyketide synthase type I PpsC [Palleronia sp. THAF1]